MLQQAASENNIQQLCNDQFTGLTPIADASSGYQHTFLTIDIPEGYAIEYIQISTEHTWYGCNERPSHYSCTDSSYHEYQSISLFYDFSEGSDPRVGNILYGGWDNISIDFDLRIIELGEYYGNQPPYEYNYYYDSLGMFSVWPSSEYEFTLYYRFVPVIPVE